MPGHVFGVVHVGLPAADEVPSWEVGQSFLRSGHAENEKVRGDWERTEDELWTVGERSLWDEGTCTASGYVSRRRVEAQGHATEENVMSGP